MFVLSLFIGDNVVSRHKKNFVSRIAGVVKKNAVSWRPADETPAGGKPVLEPVCSAMVVKTLAVEGHYMPTTLSDRLQT